MRKILFRGKRIDNGEWVEGYLIQKGGETLIVRYPYCIGKVHETSWSEFCFGGFIEVIPETVGQYTGLADKNGNEIFEGDIVKFPHGTKSMNGKIEYIEEDCIYYLTYKTGRVPFGVFFNGFELEIIGNIHDNPELLEVKK